MADAVVNKASAFTIRELTGEQRTLRLIGRALPYRPVAFSGSMRAEFTWYPGSPEATVQVLGAEEKPTTIKGMWKNRFLGEIIESEFDSIDGTSTQSTAIATLMSTGGEQALTDVMTLCFTVDDFRRKGQLIEVTWDAIVRQGILTDFVQNFDRRQDVEWEMTFGWISQGDPTVPAVTSREVSLSDVQTTWSKSLNDITDSIKNNPFTESVGIFKQINDGINNVQRNIFEITDAVEATVLSATAPLDSIKRLSGILSSIQGSASSIISTIEDTVDIAKFDLGVTIDRVTFSQNLQAAKYNRGIKNSALVSQRQAARQQQDLAKRINPNLVATFIAREGMDLRDVSFRFYGTPDEWRRLLIFNSFSSSELISGQVVLVPEAQSSDEV